MSLIRLLAVGRSIVGLKSEPPRYKLSQQSFLPKFDAAKPEANLACEDSVGTSATGGTSAAAASTLATLSDGSVSANSIFGNRFKSRNGAKATRTLVQGELALGSLKVVRNDLNDTDVEVVPAARPEAQRQTVTAPQSDPAQAGRSRGWSQLTARLFEAGGLRS